MEQRATRIITTGDGSPTLELVGSPDTYHSRHGAYTESKHVFIASGLNARHFEKRVRVFEMGFGTGLNALLALSWSMAVRKSVTYRSVELFPLTEEVWSSLDYPDFSESERELFPELHRAPWGSPVVFNDEFILWKEAVAVEDFVSGGWKADVVFYDAFGPTSQPELWEVSAMRKMFKLLDNGGVLVTYCAQGQFRRNLKEAGFKLEKVAGPPGKREMTRAWKT